MRRSQYVVVIILLILALFAGVSANACTTPTPTSTTTPAPTQNGKVSTVRTASLMVAALDSSATSKAPADYIADGANDEMEIQAAIDSLPASGGSVTLHGGTYYLSAEIAISGDNVSLIGQGNGTVLTCPDGFSSDPAEIDFAMLDITGNGVSISNLSFDGNETGIAGGVQSAIDANSAANLHIEGVRFEKFTGDGIYANSPSNLSITNSYFYQIKDDGADINNASYSVVSGNIFESIGDNGIDTESTTFSSFTGNTFNTVGGSAIELEQEGGNSWTEFVSVVGNSIYNSAEAGILINTGRNNTITGNTLDNNAIGIHLMTSAGDYHSTHNIISGNRINGGTYGIKEEDPDQDYNTIVGNIVTEASIQNVLISGANTVYSPSR